MFTPSRPVCGILINRFTKEKNDLFCQNISVIIYVTIIARIWKNTNPNSKKVYKGKGYYIWKKDVKLTE